MNAGTRRRDSGLVWGGVVITGNHLGRDKPCPYAPTQSPVFVGARLNPSYRDYERSASPLPHGTQCGASVTPPCHCEAQPKQSGGNKNGIATPPAGARNDRLARASPAPTRRPRRSVPMQSLFFVGAGLCAERARSTHARTCPYALTAAVCADPIPVFCRGESSGNGVTGEPTHLMPDAHLHCTKRSAVQVSPLPHGTRRGALPAILQI